VKARRREGLALAAAAALSCLLFLAWPGLDLALTRLLHDAKTGFFLADAAPILALYRGVPWLQRAMLAGATVVLVLSWRRPAAVPPALRRRAGMLLLVMVIGAGIVVDWGFKTHWSRPRPREVAEFGGAQPFAPVWQPVHGCPRNCSFPSGHAAVGFAWIAWGALGAPARRRRWRRIGLAAGALIGAGRLAQGAHFLSDIVFARALDVGGVPGRSHGVGRLEGVAAPRRRPGTRKGWPSLAFRRPGKGCPAPAWRVTPWRSFSASFSRAAGLVRPPQGQCQA
jgi:membrane-associated PAP2 superfamily phosphatase